MASRQALEKGLKPKQAVKYYLQLIEKIQQMSIVGTTLVVHNKDWISTRKLLNASKK